MSAKTMAEVLAEHMLVDADACGCNEMFYDTRLAPGQIAHEHSLHVEMELHNAGYGLVADAKREAWDEGYEGAVDAYDGRNVSNPYRGASNDDQ